MNKKQGKEYMAALQKEEDDFVKRVTHQGDGVKVDVKREPRKPLKKGEVRNG